MCIDHPRPPFPRCHRPPHTRVSRHFRVHNEILINFMNAECFQPEYVLVPIITFFSLPSGSGLRSLRFLNSMKLSLWASAAATTLLHALLINTFELYSSTSQPASELYVGGEVDFMQMIRGKRPAELFPPSRPSLSLTHSSRQQRICLWIKILWGFFVFWSKKFLFHACSSAVSPH